MAPLVLKLGGSLFESGQLGDVLNVVVQSTRPLVIVPGGGPFADAVRAAQRDIGFSDQMAHRMAVLAMQQMALLIADLQPKFTAATSIADFQSAWAAGQTPVWSPFEMVDADAGLPRTWSMTSDGLAAWLATRLEGASVALVKSCAVPRNATAQTLAEDSTVDAEFARIVSQSALDWQVIGAGDTQRLSKLLLTNPGDEPRLI